MKSTTASMMTLIRTIGLIAVLLALPHGANAADAAAGQAAYAVCAACHGQDARGNQALGAPNLTDGIWLHGARLEDIETTIREGRSGRMPPHDSVLSEERLHVLAAYVYGLSQP